MLFSSRFLDLVLYSHWSYAILEVSWESLVLHFQFSVIFLFLLQFSKLAKLRKDQVNLPIYRYKDMIIEAVKSNQVVIVAGDTGCGKSTQVSIPFEIHTPYPVKDLVT